jgi:hypothetical protein
MADFALLIASPEVRVHVVAIMIDNGPNVVRGFEIVKAIRTVQSRENRCCTRRALSHGAVVG